jgi:hypothetical protein
MKGWIPKVFLDTGCFKTLLPRDPAEQTGRSLGFKMKYSLGGSIIKTEAFSISNQWLLFW